MQLFKPMKGALIPCLSLLQYPLLMSPKIDGIRGTKQQGHLYAASLKLIPNKHTQKAFSDIPNYLDGELKLGDPWEDNFRDTSSAIMSYDGTPDIKFYVFDYYIPGTQAIDRYIKLTDLTMSINNPNVIIVKQELVLNETQLLELHATHLVQGYEGSMIRGLKSPYKQGKSTVNEGYLYKWKDFDDSEAVILDFLPLYTNNNEIKINELGYKSRSLEKANRVETATLGSLYVKDIKSGVEFSIGTGFTKEERLQFWEQQSTLKGKIVVYQFLKTGGYDKPRNLSFKGFRDVKDMTSY